jgi:hypothetical protein
MNELIALLVSGYNIVTGFAAALAGLISWN